MPEWTRIVLIRAGTPTTLETVSGSTLPWRCAVLQRPPRIISANSLVFLGHSPAHQVGWKKKLANGRRLASRPHGQPAGQRAGRLARTTGHRGMGTAKQARGVLTLKASFDEVAEARVRLAWFQTATHIKNL